jgi:dTDP-4-dehydrorhamnose 3,5-epimerase
VKVTALALPEVLLVEPNVFGDARGFFMESYNAERYRAAGIALPFVQDNVSASRRGVLRGLHFQHPNAQGKLVQVLAGAVFDVAVDVRAGSPTFGGWVGELLSSDNRRQLWVPPGFAHGFVVTSDEALFAYKCTAPYDQSSERSVRWDDPDIGIRWPVGDVTLSEKDRGAVPLCSVPTSHLPRYGG